MRFLLVLLLLFPFVELYFLFMVAHWAGAGVTLAFVVVTGIVGAAIARRQGWGAMARLQDEMNRGQLAATLVDAAMILVAGALLVLPGILTDLVGASLLIPPVRRLCGAGLRQWLRRHATVVSTGSTIEDRRLGDQNTIDAQVVSRGLERDPDDS
jgi:UPF0716 protein FxsA